MKKEKERLQAQQHFRYGLNEIRGVLLHLDERAQRFAQTVKELLRELLDHLEGWSILNFKLRL